jgi:uncharacterized protein
MIIDSYVTLGNERDTVYTAFDLVRDLDRAGVDMAVAAPQDSSVTVYNRRGNDFILKEAAGFPDRIIPACTVNPWYGEEAVLELSRSVSKGARMLVLNPTLQGFLINDTLADPIFMMAEELNLPVYVHTGPHLYGGPWQLIDCALRFPKVIFIMGHAGATDFWNDVPYAGKFSQNIYIEGSYARPFIFRNYLQTVGIEKGIMGSAAPRNNLPFEWSQYREYMPEDAYRAVFGENMARILHMTGGGI